MARKKNIPSAPPTHFNTTARILHWLMAAMILAMIFVGLGMMTSLTWRPWLLDLHMPIGIAILLLVIIRFINRLSFSVPKMPASISNFQSTAAGTLHWLLYAMMLALPLTGWAQLSAGGFLVKLFPGINLPSILQQSPFLYALLHDAHRVMAWLLFLMVVGHLSAALLHAWAYRDGLFSSITWGKKMINRSEEHFKKSDSLRENCKK
ncbi:cytochrome b [Pedobacter antarcticus]|uniref:Cytochrome B561 n=2 Tax=Pedobacter antarcticus TaxID=34086 RepID=A0A081PD71_9SPHI|nr:cytochrome b [Pedobacter antarcticus]KEQ28644.1 cytochrome B561 [Pedobacter antarcticus 4BY]SDL70640.1 cytochrome b561 [Pedobacter antarcticus]SFE87698.1 cytochrome b561 [Pedobacter antarcticus]